MLELLPGLSMETSRVSGMPRVALAANGKSAMIRGERLSNLTRIVHERVGHERAREWLDTPHPELANDPPELWFTRGVMGMLTPEQEILLETVVSNASLSGA
jgi:hypothetical protein